MTIVIALFKCLHARSERGVSLSTRIRGERGRSELDKRLEALMDERANLDDAAAAAGARRKFAERFAEASPAGRWRSVP